MVAIGVTGASGRMGRSIISAILMHKDATLAGATCPSGNAAIGQDAGLWAGQPANGIIIHDNPKTLFADADVVIDFTQPQASVYHASLAATYQTALVCGTTGLDSAQLAQLDAAARETPLLWAANMSVGVNLLLMLVAQAAAKLDETYDIEILEMHHRHKVDAPSGTALALAQAACDGRGYALQSAILPPHQSTKGARATGQIGMAVLRGGDVAGDHRVIFAADGERLELGHRASNRDVFAKGAVKAALWLVGQSAGRRYDMKDVLQSTINA